MATKTEEKSTEDKVSAARNKNVDLALQQIAKDYGDGAIMRLGDATIVDIDVIPTGNILIDRALGVGGFPRGRAVAVYGRESSGKTTLTRVASGLTWTICLSRSRAPAKKRCALSKRLCVPTRLTSSCSIPLRRWSRNRNSRARSAIPPSAPRRA